MKSGVTAVEVVLAAAAFAIACNPEETQEVPAKKQSLPLEAPTTRDNREYNTKGSVKERSKLGEILVMQESESPSPVQIETEPASEREEEPETGTAAVTPSSGSLTKGKNSRADAPKARINKRTPVRGSLSKEVVRRGIDKGMNHIRRCFEDGVKRNPCLGHLALVKL